MIPLRAEALVAMSRRVFKLWVVHTISLPAPKTPQALGKRKQPPSPSPPSLPQNPPTHTVPRPAPRRLLPRTPDAPTMALPSSSQQGGGLPPRPSPPPPLLLAPQPPRPLRLRAPLPRPPQAEPPPSAIPQAWQHASFHEQMSRKVTKRLYAAFKAAAHTAAKTFSCFLQHPPRRQPQSPSQPARPLPILSQGKRTSAQNPRCPPSLCRGQLARAAVGGEPTREARSTPA